VRSAGERLLKTRGERVQEIQSSGEPRELVEEDQGADENEQAAAEEFHPVQVFPEALVKLQKTAHLESGDQERDRKPRRVNGQEKHAAGDRAACGGEAQNGADDRTEAGR
jgi:hypothetical protein